MEIGFLGKLGGSAQNIEKVMLDMSSANTRMTRIRRTDEELAKDKSALTNEARTFGDWPLFYLESVKNDGCYAECAIAMIY